MLSIEIGEYVIENVGITYVPLKLRANIKLALEIRQSVVIASNLVTLYVYIAVLKRDASCKISKK